jgi:hypothetical protein
VQLNQVAARALIIVVVVELALANGMKGGDFHVMVFL